MTAFKEERMTAIDDINQTSNDQMSQNIEIPDIIGSRFIIAYEEAPSELVFIYVRDINLVTLNIGYRE